MQEELKKGDKIVHRYKRVFGTIVEKLEEDFYKIKDGNNCEHHWKLENLVKVGD